MSPQGRRRGPGRWFSRAVGLVILGLAGLAAAALWVVIAASEPPSRSRADEGLLFGVWQVVYDTEAPSVRVVVVAVALAVLFASGVALLERRIANRARRSDDEHVMPLAPRVVMAETYGVFAGEVTVTVLIPAHNEEACIGATIASLLSQSHRPARVVVVADNCTDATEDIARAAGVEVLASVGNTEKKAGALNQALRQVLPQQGDNDLVMVMDADTTLDPGFLEGAVARMTADRALMPVGDLFHGEEGEGVPVGLPRNEYVR